MTQQPLFWVSIPQNWEHLFAKMYVSYVQCSIILGGQDIETTDVFFDRWLDKEDVVHTYNGLRLIYKKRWNTAILQQCG